MSQILVDDALRELSRVAQAKLQLLEQLAQLHRDVMHLLVTSPKDRVAHGAASQVLVKTLAATRQVLEAHGGKLT